MIQIMYSKLKNNVRCVVSIVRNDVHDKKRMCSVDDEEKKRKNIPKIMFSIIKQFMFV